MKKKRFIIPLVLIVILLTFLPVNFLKANPDNLVQNGDFAGGSLSFWSTWGDIRMYQDTAGIYSSTSATSGIRQTVGTTNKNLAFSCDISPRYSGSSSGVQIAFNIYKNGVFLGQAFGYFNNLAPMQWSHISFEVEDFWHQHTGAAYADFDQIEIIIETYYGCIAFFDNISLEGAQPLGTSLELTKDAAGESEGYLTWTVEKSVNKKTFDLSIGETATAKYTVTVNPVYHETGITVSGNINIVNSGATGEAASISYVKDKVEYRTGSGPWTEITTQDISGPFSIPAGDSTSVPYSVSFEPVDGATEYRNTALVGLENYDEPGGGVGFHEFTYTAGFSISGGNITSDAYADVSDSLHGYLGETWVGDPDTYEYTYNHTIGPYSSSGSYKIDNTATVTGKNSGTTASDSESVKAKVAGTGKITVHKELKAPDGKSEPFIPDKHEFKITLQKQTSSAGWQDVETKKITGGGAQVFNADAGFNYRVIEADDRDYINVSNSGTVTIEKTNQSADIFLKSKQKYAAIKVTKNVVGSTGKDIADHHWFLVKLKGGSPTIYQPFNESFYTYFIVWPGTYSAVELPEDGYELENNGGSITVKSNTIKNIIKVTNKQSSIDYDVPDDFSTVTEAIVSALSNSSKIDYIYIADGKYPGDIKIDIPDGNTLFLIGESNDGTVLDGQGKSRVIQISGNGIVHLNNLTVTNGIGWGAGIGVAAGTTLFLDNCILKNNASDSHGGGIDNSGTVYAKNCLITANSAHLSGAGIYNDGGTLFIEKSSISGNDSTIQSGIAATNTVNAKNNWWGSPSGPSGAGPGTGDSISGKVLYDPWLTSDPF